MSNFWRSVETPLVKCKIELKPKQTKGGVLVAFGNDNADFNSDNNIFTIQDKKSFVAVVTLSAKHNQKWRTKKKFQTGELSHELFLSTRQKTKIGNAFANNMSTDT